MAMCPLCVCICVCMWRDCPTGCAIEFGSVQLCYIQSPTEVVKICTHTYTYVHTHVKPQPNISISLLNSSETFSNTVENLENMQLRIVIESVYLLETCNHY